MTPSPAPQTFGVLTDAMVGQVNGKPIYVNSIFDAIGTEVLKRLGEDRRRGEFRLRAEELIGAHLDSRITDELILGEAERNLTEQEQRALTIMKERQREDLLAIWGGGVLAQAEDALQEAKGHGMEEELREWRQGVVVSKLLGAKVRPKIHVHKKEVERHFRDHPERFGPSAKVTLRLILVADEASAAAVDQSLAQGTDFEEVARTHGTLRKDQGGLLDPFVLEGSLQSFDELAWERLNEEVRKLKAGQHTHRVPVVGGFTWAKLEALEGNQAKKLQDVFIQIERELLRQKADRLHRRFIDDLRRKGNFTTLSTMLDAALEAAMVRYAVAS